MPPNPLPAANSRRPFCFRRLPEMRRPLPSPELGSAAAVAEGGCSAIFPRIMQALKSRSVLTLLVGLVSLSCGAQSNVYSLAVYSGGTSYADLCSLAFPFPPYQYQISERSWYEDANGLTIIDLGHERARGGMLQRVIEVKCGSNSFSMRLDSGRRKGVSADANLAGAKGSGDLAKLISECMATRGGQVTTNRLPVVQVSWVRRPLEVQDIIVVEGEHFTEVQKLLAQAYGAPDATVRSSAPVGNGRSLTYTPKQIGVVLNLTAGSGQTFVSVIGRHKP
jgi:hypothetical protein